MTFFDCPHCEKPILVMRPDTTKVKKEPLGGDLETELSPYSDYIQVLKDRVQMITYLRGDKGKQIWAQINDIIKRYGGKWVSDKVAKEFYWSVPT